MKLLDKSIRSYLLYAIGIFIVSVPLFYFVIQNIISKDVDRGLYLQKREVVRGIERTADTDPFAILDLFGPDIMINRLRTYQSFDTLYTEKKLDKITHRVVSYRVLESNIFIRGLPYKIIVQNSLVNSQDLIQSIVWIMGLLLLLIIFGMLLINRELSRKLWQPFNHTLSQIQRFRVDSPTPLPLRNTEIEEFSNLNHAVAQLAENNRQLFELQKEFTENASHEMQTPLAVLQSKLELLMQTNPISDDQAMLIEQLSDASMRLARLNKTLLLLTRIENNQYTAKEQVDIDEILSKTLAQFADTLEARNIELTENLEPADVCMNRTLAEILSANLISNAVRHNVSGGKIQVILTAGSLTVRNTGQALSLDEQQIFRRFYKAGSDHASLGLGLQIVKKICDLNGFAVRYQLNAAMHEFTISFNASSHRPGKE